MSSFSLHVATDNAAFSPSPAGELADLLRDIADRLDAGHIDPADSRYGANEGTVTDHNGNTCGRWFWTGRTCSHDDAAALDAITHAVETHGRELPDGYALVAAIADWIRQTGREVAP